MEVFRRPLSHVFSNDRRYVVPLFQRPYVWNQEDQWEPLWQDIIACAEAELGEHRDDVPMHFLGAIVIQQLPVWGDSLPAHDVIDGQQRLTTFQILLSALRDIAKAREDQQVFAWLDAQTRNPGAIANPEVERFKLWPTKRDAEQFRLVSTAGSPEAILAVHPPVYRRRRLQPRPRMVEAYLFFHQEIMQWLGDDGSAAASERLRVLRRVIDRRLELVSIELAGNEDPQAIFETMNSRGVPLLASDLLRNYVFQRAGDDADRLYKSYWLRFEEPDRPACPEGARFWEVDERQGRLFRARLDLFIQHYLTMKLERDITSSRLFHEYKHWIESKQPYAELDDEVSDFVRFADHFKMLLRPEGELPAAAFARHLHVLDVSTVYPLVLAVLADQRLSATDRASIFQDLESFLVRRLVCGRPTKGYNRLFLQVLKDYRSSQAPGAHVIRDTLRASSGDNVDWPSDEDFRGAWISVDAYRDLKPTKVEMVLRAIENAMRDAKSEQITVHGDLTVEHVMPRAWQDNWPLPPASDVNTARQEREESLHDFGNLTLLTQPLNSSVNNSGANQKLPLIAQQSALRINSYFQGRTSWTEADIRERSVRLFDVAKRIWPRPA